MTLEQTKRLSNASLQRIVNNVIINVRKMRMSEQLT